MRFLFGQFVPAQVSDEEEGDEQKPTPGLVEYAEQDDAEQESDKKGLSPNGLFELAGFFEEFRV